MLCYHGTSADNLESILKFGLEIDSPKIWKPSLKEIYCWSKNYIEGELRYDEDDGPYDEADYKDRMISAAFDSAFVALSKAKDCRAIVVIFNVNESELNDDSSCENMEHANSVGRNIKPHEIVEVLVSNDLGLLRGYFVGLTMNRELAMVNYSAIESRIGQMFHKCEFYPEDIEDILRWDTVYQHRHGIPNNELVLV